MLWGTPLSALSSQQEGTSKFATLEMNPKRAQKRQKETVSVPTPLSTRAGARALGLRWERLWGSDSGGVWSS